MENQNILTIKFNTLDDLAVQVADWNERLNHQCCGNCHDDKTHVETACETIDVEAVTSKVESEVVKVEKAEAKEEKASNKAAKEEQKQDVPVTDFEGKPTQTKPKNEEKVEPVSEPEPAEATKSEDSTPADTELDVAAEPVDKKAFYKKFREWMGEDGVKAKKALAIFSKHGVTRPSSDSLTDDLITDLKSIMAEKEA